VYYDAGIQCANTCTITGNVIDGISVGFGVLGGYGILVGTASVSEHLVTNNKIDRRGDTIAAYIGLVSGAQTEGMVVDNIFDSPTIDNSDTTVILSVGDVSGWVIERNKNQTETIYLTSSMGKQTMGLPNFVIGAALDLYGDSRINLDTIGFTDDESTQVEFEFDGYSTVNVSTWRWDFNLASILPLHTTLTSASVKTIARASVAAATTNQARMQIKDLSTSYYDNTTNPGFATTFTTLSSGTISAKNNPNTGLTLALTGSYATPQDDIHDNDLRFATVVAVYRW
jgi:hypothetical protein